MKRERRPLLSTANRAEIPKKWFFVAGGLRAAQQTALFLSVSGVCYLMRPSEGDKIRL